MKKIKVVISLILVVSMLLAVTGVANAKYGLAGAFAVYSYKPKKAIIVLNNIEKYNKIKVKYADNKAFKKAKTRLFKVKKDKSIYSVGSLKKGKKYFFKVKRRTKAGKWLKWTRAKGVEIVKVPNPYFSLGWKVPLYSGIAVNKGKSVAKKVNLKGKTVTMAITNEAQYSSAEFKGAVTAFEKKYGCKVKVKQLDFDTYNSDVKKARDKGKSYDICFAHGSMYPQCAVEDLYEDLSGYLYEGDLMNKKKPLKGGIDCDKSSYFAHNSKLYGVCSYKSVYPYIMYYNKLQMEKAGYGGSNSPRNLAKSGKWTWEKIKSMGKELTKEKDDVYFLSNSFAGRGITLSFGAPVVVKKQGAYKQNITSNAFITALNTMKDFFNGENHIAEPIDVNHQVNSHASFLSGKAYIYFEESSKYLDLAREVKDSDAFERKKSNLAIVKAPLGETNKAKAYPTGWLTAVCCGKGRNPKVAMAWQDFYSAYSSNNRDVNGMSDADIKYCNNLIKGKICCEVGCFSSKETNTLALTEGGVVRSVSLGEGDPATLVKSVKGQMTKCIRATVEK